MISYSARRAQCSDRQGRSFARYCVATVCQLALLLALLPATNEARGAEGAEAFAKETIEYVSNSKSEVRVREASRTVQAGSHFSHKVLLRVLPVAYETVGCGHRLANGLLAPLHC